jgi:hypothetical protein
VSAGDDNPESRSLLGSMHKRRYLATGLEADLDDAIKHYGIAFDASPQELYLGRTLAQLLYRKGDPDSKDRLRRRLPDLLSLAQHEISEPPLDYWQLESALVLAVIGGDRPAAESLAARMTNDAKPQPWMLDSTRTELQQLVDGAADPAARDLVATLLLSLQASDSPADDEEAGDAQL